MTSTAKSIATRLAAGTIPLAVGLSRIAKTAADYSVARGDTLSGIAAKHGTTWQNLAKLNGVSDPRRLQIGQRLRIPGQITPPATVPAQPVSPVSAPVARAAYPGKRNNPGNMRDFGVKWYGKVDRGVSDGSFAVFKSPQDGLRAAGRNLHTLAARLKNPTLRTLIPLYAPPKENNTAGYINDVSRFSGISADKVLNLNDHRQLAALLPHIVRRESGLNVSKWYTPAEYVEAARRAMKSI